MALKQFQVGDVLGAADVNQYLVNTGFAVKTLAQTRTSAPGLADDADLQLPIVAGAYYLLKLQAQFISPSAASFQFTFTGSGGDVLYGSWLHWNPSGSPQYAQPSGSLDTSTYDGTSNLFTATQVLSGTSGTTANWLRVEGILYGGSSAGTLKWRWSQQTSNAGATTVNAGSSLCLWQVG